MTLLDELLIEDGKANGARIFEFAPELDRYTIPVPVLGFGRAIPDDGAGVDDSDIDRLDSGNGGERGERREDIDERDVKLKLVEEEEESGMIDGTGTAGLSLPRAAAARGSCKGLTFGETGVLADVGKKAAGEGV